MSTSTRSIPTVHQATIQVPTLSSTPWNAQNHRTYYPNPLTHAAHALHNPHQASPPPPPLPLHHLHLTLTNNPRQHPLLLSQLSLPPFNITFPLWYTSYPGTFRQLKETNRKAPPIKTTRISVPEFSGTICISGSWLLAGEGCCLWGVLGDWVKVSAWGKGVGFAACVWCFWPDEFGL